MAEAAEQHCTAFGLELRIDPRISLSGLGLGGGRAGMQPPSRVRLDAAELGRRWRAISRPPVRTRELSCGETLLRTVDFAEPAGHLLWARGYGHVLVSPDGAELLCAPDPGNEEWASIVTAQALPLAATIRGIEVLHASGVVLDGRALLFAGPPGAGKSSLAAALVRGGGRLLSDDAVALTLRGGALVAHPGCAALQLRAAEHERLGARERAALGQPAGAVEDKRRYVSARAPEAVPLAYLFLLERAARGPVVEPLHAVDPFELIAQTFNVSVRTPARLRRQLDVVCAIAANGIVHRLRVRAGVDASALALLVREHVARAEAPRAVARARGGRTRELLAEI